MLIYVVLKLATKRSLIKASGCPTQMPAEATVPGMAMCYTVLGNGATRNPVSSFNEEKLNAVNHEQSKG